MFAGSLSSMIGGGKKKRKNPAGSQGSTADVSPDSSSDPSYHDDADESSAPSSSQVSEGTAAKISSLYKAISVLKTLSKEKRASEMRKEKEQQRKKRKIEAAEAKVAAEKAEAERVAEEQRAEAERLEAEKKAKEEADLALKKAKEEAEMLEKKAKEDAEAAQRAAELAKQFVLHADTSAVNTSVFDDEPLRFTTHRNQLLPYPQKAHLDDHIPRSENGEIFNGNFVAIDKVLRARFPEDIESVVKKFSKRHKDDATGVITYTTTRTDVLRKRQAVLDTIDNELDSATTEGAKEFWTKARKMLEDKLYFIFGKNVDERPSLISVFEDDKQEEPFTKVFAFYERGGVVKGKKDEAVPIIAHAGELVVPKDVVPAVLKSHSWRDHVRNIAAERKISYKEAMKVAAGTYVKKKKVSFKADGEVE